jgi:chromosome partitioning protein
MISVIGNLKGGTGKSTVAFNLSLWIAMNRNVHVVVYDLDPQATLTDALEIRTEDGHQPAIIPNSQLENLDKENEYTEVLIDIGMSDLKAMKQAIRKADRVIVPIAPSQADVWSTQRFISMVVDICGSDMPEIIGFMNRAYTHIAVRETDEAFAALSTLKNIKMLNERLYQRTAYRRSFSEGLAVFEMDRRSKAAQEVKALGKVLY